MNKIKTGDSVKVLSGKDRGKTGSVVQILTNNKTNQTYVVVDGVNLRKKHLRSRAAGQQGQIIELPAPLHISNVMLIDPSSKKPTRVGIKVDGDKKTRVAKRGGAVIE
jgi:large subunit ribosomal protein L24